MKTKKWTVLLAVAAMAGMPSGRVRAEAMEGSDGPCESLAVQESAALEAVEQTAAQTPEETGKVQPERKKGLVLHYAFGRGGNWKTGSVMKDLSGCGHDGRVEGDGLEAVDGIGKREKAARFDGKCDYIRVPRDAALEPQEITVAAWVRVREGVNSSGTDKVGVLVFKRNSSFHYNENYCFEIFPNHVMRATFGYPPTSQTGVNLAGPLSPQLWHHVAMTFRNGDVRVYLDGEESGQGCFPYQLDSKSDADLLIGVRDHAEFPLGRFGAFDLADLKIWNEALDRERVATLYKERAKKENVAKPAKKGVVLHYAFDQRGDWKTGKIVKDLSGEGHDGKVEGNGLEVVPGMGKSGKAVRFDGDGDYIRVSRDAALEPAEVSVAAWIRIREDDRGAGEDGIGVLVFKRNSSFHDNEDYCIEIHPNHAPQGEIANPRGMHSRVPSGKSLAPDLWHHVVLTAGNGEIRIYIDGERTVSRSHPYPQDHNTGADLFVGTRDHAQYPLGHFGAFDLAELTIWNEVLDGERVAALYRERAGRRGVAKPEDNCNAEVKTTVVVPPYHRIPPRVFSPWKPGEVEPEEKMALALRALVSQGRRDRAASPEFLDALDRVLEKYRETEGWSVGKPSDQLPLKPEFRGPGMPPGWSAVDPSVWRFGDGEARQILSRANTRYVLFYEPGKAWTDYTATVKFESDAWFTPPANSCAALWLRYKGVDDAYCVHFDGNGNVSVISCEPGGKGRVIARTAAGSEVVKDGKPWTVRAKGEEIVVEHEGRRYLEVHDGTHREGTVGVESIHIPMRFKDVEIR